MFLQVPVCGRRSSLVETSLRCSTSSAGGVLQLLVEGGSHVAHAFHRDGLVDRYVWYLAPAFLGGDDGRPIFAGPGAATMASAWRGRLVSVRWLGGDLRIDVEPDPVHFPKPSVARRGTSPT